MAERGAAQSRRPALTAIEFLDDTSMRAVTGIGGLPGFLASRPEGSAALLIDYQRPSVDSVRAATTRALPRLEALSGLIAMSEFTATPKSTGDSGASGRTFSPSSAATARRGRLSCSRTWPFPSNGSRALLKGLKALFERHGYTGEGQGVQFGHASAGNVHFMLTADFTQQREVDRYTAFMRDAVTLCVNELDGSLKAEHGTGRAIAPFVSREWGDKAYAIMKRIKELLDPDGLLNPGVLINADPDVLSKNIKRTPSVSSLIDRCTECGFCEHVCPSRLVTMTPRGRIQASRKHFELLAAR